MNAAKIGSPCVYQNGLQSKDQPGRRGSCARVKAMLDAKLAQLEEQFGQMKQLRFDLLRLRKRCEEALAVDASCPVIIDFSKIVTSSNEKETDSKKRRRV